MKTLLSSPLHIHSYSVTLEGWSHTPYGATENNVLPKKIKRFTVLRSPHIDKKSRDQFEQKIRKNSIIMVNHNRVKTKVTAADTIPQSGTNAHNQINGQETSPSLIKGVIHPTLILDQGSLEKLPVGVRIRLDLTEILFA